MELHLWAAHAQSTLFFASSKKPLMFISSDAMLLHLLPDYLIENDGVSVLHVSTIRKLQKVTLLAAGIEPASRRPQRRVLTTILRKPLTDRLRPS